MEKLNFDTGLREFEVNGNGIFRFNPGDPNVYSRFADAADRIGKIEEELVARAEEIRENPDQNETTVFRLMEEADKKIKDVLGWVFGSGNDFHVIFGGVNLMAVASNGERVLTNFLAAIQPVMMEGLQKSAREQAVAIAAKMKSGNHQK